MSYHDDPIAVITGHNMRVSQTGLHLSLIHILLPEESCSSWVSMRKSASSSSSRIAKLSKGVSVTILDARDVYKRQPPGS